MNSKQRNEKGITCAPESNVGIKSGLQQPNYALWKISEYYFRLNGFPVELFMSVRVNINSDYMQQHLFDRRLVLASTVFNNLLFHTTCSKLNQE